MAAIGYSQGISTHSIVAQSVNNNTIEIFLGNNYIMMGNNKFAVDVMLGRVARWLRIFGYDTLYQSKVDDDELLFRSLLEERILFTCDIRLAQRAGSAAYLVKTKTLWKRLREIIDRFGIEPKLCLKYCPVCNGKIIEVPKQSVSEMVPKYTFMTHEQFYRCRKCGKIYWRGSHIELAQKDILKKVMCENNTKTDTYD